MTPAEIEWINELRRHEIRTVLAHLPGLAGDLLEIGGGSGQQARLLANAGLRVTAIDIPSSDYRERRVFPVRDYDGEHIPFPDASFDVVFSSNALEHIPHLDGLEREIARVLRPGGRAVHVLPTHHWRLWSWLAHYPALLVYPWRHRGSGEAGRAGSDREPGKRPLLLRVLLPGRHGERGNALTEYCYFRPRWWAAHFERAGWRVRESFPLGLAYTGYMIANRRLSLVARARLATYIGSATRCYVLEKRS